MNHCYDPKKLIHTEQGIKWLSQFEAIDKDTAIHIANNLTLVSHNEFERNLTKKIEEVASNINGSVGLFAVRELKKNKLDNGIEVDLIPFYSQVESTDGRSVNSLSSTSDQGSEARVAHIIRQLCKSDPNKYLNHPTIDFIRERKCDAIIFVDDFVGSGKRVCDFLRSFWIEPTIVSWLSGKQMYFHVVSYSGTDRGIRNVVSDRARPKVSIYRDAPTIDTIFWSEKKRRHAEAICAKYGKKANRKRKNMWLGFNSGKATIIFEHGCPNNTPSMLWEPNFKESGWLGLFPNRTVSSDTASVFPDEIVRGDPVKLMADIGQSRLARSGALLRRGPIGIAILTALALAAKGQRKRSAISFATGFDVENCERLIELCIKWEFMTVQRRITAKGLSELNAARKVKPRDFAPLEIGSDYYYPQQLRGRM